MFSLCVDYKISFSFAAFNPSNQLERDFYLVSKITAIHYIAGKLDPSLFQRFGLMCIFLCSYFFCIAQISETDSLTLGHDTIKIIAADSLVFNPANQKSSFDTEVQYGATDSILLDMKVKKAYLHKDAWILYGGIKLTADFMIVDFEKKEVFARGVIDDSTKKYNGKPVFKDGEQVYEADTMAYNFETKKGLSKGVLTTEKDGYVHGETIVRDSLENIYVRNGRFTTCNLPEPHFHIAASKIKIIPKKQIVTGPANLMIGDIKTPLVVPFGFFPTPTKNTHGLLMPTFGESPNQGFNFRGLGYYFPINDYFDFQVTGDFYFRGSWGVGINSNYNKRYKYNGYINLAYNFNKLGEPESPTYLESNDVKIIWQYAQDGKANPNQSFSANVNFFTSSYLKNNTLNVNSFDKNNANSSVQYSRFLFNKKLNLGVTSSINQVLSTGKVDLTLPTLTASLVRQTPFNDFTSKNKTLRSFMRNLNYQYSSRFENFLDTKEEYLLKPSILDSLELGATHNIPISTKITLLKWFTLNPSFNLNEYWFFSTTSKIYNQETRLLDPQVNSDFNRALTWNANVALNTQIYGLKNFKKGKIQALRHQITPSLSGNFRPDYSVLGKFGNREVKDSLGRTLRYNEYDSKNGRFRFPNAGPTGGFSFNINNNLSAKIRTAVDSTNEEGVKKINLIESLSLGGAYNFLADSFKLSNLSFSAFTTLFNRFRINFNSSFDPYHYVMGENSPYRTKEYALTKVGNLGRFRNTSFLLSFALNPEVFKAKKSKQLSAIELDRINQYAFEMLDFNIPWSLNISYTLSFDKPYFNPRLFTQNSLSINGDVSITENWKVVFRTGYDIERAEVNNTYFGISRLLHCWEFHLDWNPIGQYQSYQFRINVRPGSLEALKLSRNRTWRDN